MKILPDPRLAAMACLLALFACSGPTTDPLPTAALDHAIGDVIGDPATCVLLAERRTGRIVYRYGDDFNCQRALAACDRPGTLSAKSALALAGAPGGRGASCSSNPERTRTVGWAEGGVPSSARALVYSAVMEGQTALPGQEISARLNGAFHQAGL